MKKPAAIITVAVALVATLAFLLRKVGEFDDAHHERFQTTLWQLKQLDTTFNEGVLKSRFALVDNYDDFETHAAALKQSLEILRQPPLFIAPAGRAAIVNAHQEYLALLTERQKLFERFKTQNAMVSNSRRYLPGALEELSTRLTSGAATNPDTLALQSFTADISRLLLKRLSTPDDTLDDAQLRLQQLKDWCAQHPEHPEARFAASLVRHAANIVKGNTTVDAMTRQLLALPTSATIQKISGAYETELTAALRRTQQFRTLLFGLGFITVVGLGCLYWALHVANRNLESRVQARTAELCEKNSVLETAIDEQRRTAGALLESQSLYNSLVEHLPAGIFRKDSAGRFVFVNSWFCRLKKLPLEDILGRTPPEVAAREVAGPQRKNPDTSFASRLAALGLEHHAQIMRAGQPIEVNEEHPALDGGRQFLRVIKSPVFGADGKITGSQGLMLDVTDSRRAEEKLAQVHKQLLETSRQAGMAEVATNVLHNVGNVLNSVNVSATLVAEVAKKSRAASLQKVVAMLDTHASDLGNFLTTDPKGVQLPGYLRQLSEHLTREQQSAIIELDSLCKNIEHIKGIVAMQQDFAKVSGVTETVHVPDLVEDALRMNNASLQRHDIQVHREFAPLPPINLDKYKTLQILVNLIRNAKHACEDSGRDEKLLTVRAVNGGNTIKISVSDNGVGIPPENLDRIFNHGFTTKKNGHGFGLHSGANAAKEMGGALRVHSDGLGTGATFTLELPAEEQPA